MPSVFFETFGCQMNVADSEMLAELLQSRGYLPAARPGSADLLVVNTCSVREKAEKRAQARLREYAALKHASGGRQAIWVIGCMAERLGDELKALIPGIDCVIGAKRMESICHDLDHFLASTDTAPTAAAGSVTPVSMFLPVMRGCDNYCAYCIVPYVRGHEHSLSTAEILQRARSLVASGTREIVLLGQNVNSYRDDGRDFSALLERLHEVEGLQRIRFTTSHPKDLGERLIETIARLPRLCKHIHLPVQSGSTRILGLMNRKYSREEYLQRVAMIRRLMPDADLTTDVMVGFPGETEDDFEQTLALFREVEYTAAFQFAFSVREGTAASRMPDQIAPEVKSRRLAQLIELQNAITRKRFAAMVGRSVPVLFTQPQQDDAQMWMGQDDGCKRVLTRCDHSLAGTILLVKIVRSTGKTLLGEPV
jgi:tRNA-2-methylthio-N6-dimethylallyladenosine synthase